MRSVPRIFSGLAVVLALVPFGCNSYSGVTKVTGTVTMDKAPLTGAHVQFLPRNREDMHLGEFGGISDGDGKFEVLLGPKMGKFAQPGQFVLVVTKGAGIGAPPASDLKDEERTKELMKTGPGTGGGTLPAIYGDRNRSPFKVELTAGVNAVGSFDLKTKPK
jgi:hypothetical protein